MATRSDVEWEACAEDACVGVQLPAGGRCWAHAKAQDIDTALERLREGSPIDGRGVGFTADLLQRLLRATPHDDEGRHVISTALFGGATFTGDAGFSNATFTGDAGFDYATFARDARFEGATFTGDAGFYSATLMGNATFTGATFRGNATFTGAAFRGDTEFGDATFTGDAEFYSATYTGNAGFNDATFTGNAGFHHAIFAADARFTGTTFTGDARFTGATFTGDARFNNATVRGDAGFGHATFTGKAGFNDATFTDAVFGGATFTGDAGFGGVTFTGNAIFIGATFERAHQLGPMLVNGLMVLDHAEFRERIQIEIGAAGLSCRRAQFLAGVFLRVRWAQVVMDEVVLAAASVLRGARPFPGLDDGDYEVWSSVWPVDRNGTPRLVSVRGVDLGTLTLTNVDLSVCRFVDAYHLDHIRADVSNFAKAPPGWRWAKRRVIAEERQWRASHYRGGQGWYGADDEPPEWVGDHARSAGPAGLLFPGDIVGLYRELRKGVEDRKDEPGAADFYYGEMEMRRHAKRQPLRGFDISAATEWAILTLYWLVSGYGLRAWRALASLAAVVLVASVIFVLWGFAGPDQPFAIALRYSTQATTALLRGPDPRPLTEVGEWLQIALRLIGPVLLGLAVLSVRGRVKR